MDAKTKRQAVSPLYTVDTYMHIIADNASASPTSSSYVTDSQIRAQFEYLARAYTETSIGFRLLGYSRRTNDTWARNGDDLEMKTQLRRGGYSTLNIYYQSQLQAASGTSGVPVGSVLLGFCSLPVAGVGERTPTAAYVLDGCNILSGTMPGGEMFGYNRGGSTVHEVGHWNGLFHTFQGNSCGSGDFGDFVADTPQQATSTSGCPAAKDSCPNSGAAPGYDGSSGKFHAGFVILGQVTTALLNSTKERERSSKLKGLNHFPISAFRHFHAFSMLPIEPYLSLLLLLSSISLTEANLVNQYHPAGFNNPYGPQGYSGPDPINNFMDYSIDACYTGFTPGQGGRMLNIWQLYREGR